MYLGAWGYRGMYAIIAIPRLCQEERTKGIVPHSTKRGTMAPAPLSFKTPGGGGEGGLGGVAYKDRARLPTWALTQTLAVRLLR